MLAQFKDSGSRPFDVISRGNPTRLVSQDNILCHGQRGNEHEVLVDHTNLQANSIAGSGNVNMLAIDENFTAVRVDQAVEDVHQGGFAGAVFSNQGVNLSLTNRQVDLIVGNYARPGLADVVHLHGKRYITLFSWSYNCTFLHRFCSLATWGPDLSRPIGTNLSRA